MANRSIQGVVKYLSSIVFGKDGKQITSQTEAWRQEAECGCGIDCCNKVLVLTDTVTNEPYYIYIADGELVHNLKSAGVVPPAPPVI